MGRLFGRMRGGLAISVVAVGALLAASTGVVGASVVTMAVLALPVMLKYGYDRAWPAAHCRQRNPGADHPAEHRADHPGRPDGP
jgi:TRAP-type C4-dicarboxylate transport system permease large subunit